MSVCLFKQTGINGGIIKDPINQSLFCSTAIIVFSVLHIRCPGEQLCFGNCVCTTRKLRLIGDTGGHHRLHTVDVLQFILCIFQLQLQLFHIQPLSFQLQIRQACIEGHQQITFFHQISLLYQNFCHCLGIRQKNSLNLVCTHRAAALLRISPVFCHSHILKRYNINRLGAVMPRIIPKTTANCCSCNTADCTDHPFFLFVPKLFPIRFHGQPPSYHRCRARHPEYDKFCRHTPQLPARG